MRECWRNILLLPIKIPIINKMWRTQYDAHDVDICASIEKQALVSIPSSRRLQAAALVSIPWALNKIVEARTNHAALKHTLVQNEDEPIASVRTTAETQLSRLREREQGCTDPIGNNLDGDPVVSFPWMYTYISIHSTRRCPVQTQSWKLFRGIWLPNFLVFRGRYLSFRGRQPVVSSPCM